MPNYRLFCFEDGKLVGAMAIDAANDSAAVAIAKRDGLGQVVEVWKGERRIRIVAPAAAVQKGRYAARA